MLSQLPARISGGVLGVTSQVFGAVVSFLMVVVVVVFIVYFPLDPPRLRHGVVRLFPVDRREWYDQVVDIMVSEVGDYMIGRLAIGFIAGVVAFAGLEALGVREPGAAPERRASMSEGGKGRSSPAPLALFGSVGGVRNRD